MQSGEHGRWRAWFKLEKYHEDIEPYRGHEPDFYERFRPYDVVEGEGNIFVNVGVALMLDLLIGAGGTVFNNANSHLGVGDGTTAAAASQTDLLGTNKTRKAMEATYPSRSGQLVTWRSAFGPTEANHGWKEWAIFNAAAAGTMFNRRLNDFGTKTGGTWTLTVTGTVT